MASSGFEGAILLFSLDFNTVSYWVLTDHRHLSAELKI